MQYDNYTSPSFFSNFLGLAYVSDDLTTAPATVDPRAAFPVVSSGSHLDQPGLWRIDNSMFEMQTISEDLKQEPRLTFPWATLPSNEHLDLPAALPPLNSVIRPRSHLKANRKDKWICECNFEADKNYKMSRHKKYSCPLGPKQVPQCPTCHRRFSRADSLTRHLDNPAQCGKNVARRQRQDPSTMRLQSPQIDSTPSSGCPAPSLASDNSSSKPFLGFASAPSAGSSSSNGDSYQNDLFYSSDSPQDDYTLFYPDN
ncbi:hypothetical protein CCMSSC00406_0009532 [Pleurotus cornucopiae]|uniref:Uncharacterized protein n=1 Tax=Pleurotus cornucopiae TaxID=5321 RepID=A0ACB7IP22_PLECO|nr:hypothetical protein CCMSSC00406_0009532 [Pleurotus cornucopiae]